METNKDAKYLDTSLSFEERVDDLVSRMTVEEKISQTLYQAPAIPRLGVPDYNWWNECLHGVARAGVATVFPQAIGMAASFDESEMFAVADIISEEGRAKYHEFDRQGDHGIYKGLTFWTPNINIFRDPRWGRGQETYGEDPYLTGRMGVAFIKGLQGDHEKYLKSVATPKHYAVHSGPETLRHEFDAVVSEKEMRETYLPAFKEAVKEASAYSVMGAYNRTNGEPCCAHSVLMEEILRGEWGFDGYYVSDCGAIQDFNLHHKITGSFAESAALAVKTGCDLNCGKTYEHLVEAVEKGLLTEEHLDIAVKRLFMARFKLGLFDPPEMVPYASISYEVNACKTHRNKALQMTRKSMVLLKNEANTLPLSKELKTVSVIGPNADNYEIIIGNYFGTPSEYTTPLQGIGDAVSASTRVYYAEGCSLAGTNDGFWGDAATKGFAEAVAAAQRSDVAIMCLGLSPSLEGEEGATANSDGGGDKVDIGLPGMQQQLLEAVHATGTPVVLVLLNGSPVSVTWAQDNVSAILEAWYPGQEAGTAIAEVLFGDYNPGGRLPITFPKSLDQVPEFTDYRMDGRTYRFMTDEPLYPFGFGLSYSQFQYTDLTLSSASLAAGDDLELSVKVTNSGDRDGDEVTQIYLSDREASCRVPIRQLVAMRRVSIPAGESTNETFTVTPRQMALIREGGSCVLEPGVFGLSVGGSQPDDLSVRLTGQKPLQTDITVTGDVLPLEY